MVWPFERGVHRQHDLVDAAGGDAADQPVDGEVLGPHAFERRQPPAEHVVAAGEQPRAVERPQVGDFLDHAQRARRRGAGRGRCRTGRRCRHCRRSSRSTACRRPSAARRAAAAARSRASSSGAAPRAAPSAGRAPAAAPAPAPALRSPGLAMRCMRDRSICARLAKSLRHSAARCASSSWDRRTSRCRASTRWSRPGTRSSRVYTQPPRPAGRGKARAHDRRPRARRGARDRGAHARSRCATRRSRRGSRRSTPISRWSPPTG